MPILEKCCKDCNTLKPIKEFYISINSKDGFRSSCKQCMKSYGQRRSAISNARQRERYATDSTLRENYARARLKYKYGLSLEEYQNMMDTQNGKCFLTEKETDDLCIDHIHGTKQVRKLLCREINAALGAFEKFSNPIQLLRKAADYLERYGY